MTDKVCYDTTDTTTAVTPWIGNPLSRFMEGYWDYDFSPGFNPRFEMRETDSAITLIFEIPGVKKEDLHLDISDGRLRVRGERKSPELKKNEECMCSDLGYWTFDRSFGLPDSIDEGTVKAKHHDGLLELTIGKREGKKRKAIEIKVE